MATHRFRVRRNTPKGLAVVGFFQNIGVAHRVASKRMRETGNMFRIERKTSLGWETALELAPQIETAIERELSRGRLPKVQERGTGRKGQVLSYMRPSREVRVVWLDVETPGRGATVSVATLELR